MSAKIIFRVAAVLFVLFATGHTIGFLNFNPPTPESQAAKTAMNNASFIIDGRTYSLAGFYVGFGLYITLYLLFSAVLSWQLGAAAANPTRAISGIAWSFFAVQLFGILLAWKYFGLPPLVLSVTVAACLGFAASRLQGNLSS